MSHGNHTAKIERRKRSQEFFDRLESEETYEVIILAKGDLRGVLTVKETTMNWNVFSDPDFSQHLNWNHPECFPDFHKNRQHLNPLHFVSMLIENGWKSIENR